MSAQDPLVAACLDKIRAYGNVSFVELERVLKEQGVNPTGDFEFVLNDCPNTVLWVGMSEEFCRVVADLHATCLTVRTPTDLLVYMVDGSIPRLPIAKRPSRRGYRKPHWLPVVFNMAP